MHVWLVNVNKLIISSENIFVKYRYAAGVTWFHLTILESHVRLDLLIPFKTMSIEITVESEIIGDQKRFTITVDKPEQDKASFVHKDGFHFHSLVFDKMMAYVFGLKFDYHKVDKKALSVGLPGGYRDVKLEDEYAPIKDHRVVVDRLHCVLVEVADSIKHNATEAYRS